jgi:hypothetical protein
MNLNRMFTMAAIVMTATMATAKDFNQPSSGIPGGYSRDEVKQIVSIIVDDNGYSGEVGTQFEPAPGTTTPVYADMGFVGRTANRDGLEIEEGEMGLSWMVRGLAAGKSGPAPESWLGQSGAGPYTVNHNGKSWTNSYWVESTDEPGSADAWKENGPAKADVAQTRFNPDGSDLHFTFNMISGLFIPTYGPSWKDRQSEYGSYKDESAEHTAIAIAWGREYQIGTSKGGAETQPSFMIAGVQKMIADGHEIGNHTIDHIETNSPLPDDLWPGGWGWENGFDDGRGQDALGNTWSEQQEFGGAANSYAQTHGWQQAAGKAISVGTWEGIIELGEMDGPKQGVNDDLVGFRAPRLEVNSAMMYALSNKGYLYDCGLEEGYETNRDGSNFVWPYTTDNGFLNTYTQRANGEKLYFDSLPQGLWQYPVNTMIVPQEIRDAILVKANQIAVGSGEEPMDSWDGRVTGFDFNMFILFGMSEEEVYKTLKNTLDLRLAGNKAPMQIGWHSDYNTPVYDNATLLSDGNKDSYGLSVVNGWNSWESRKNALDRFVDYALGKDAYFYSGKETIEYVKSLVNNPKVAEGTNVVSITDGFTFTEVDKDAVEVDVIDQAVEFPTEEHWSFFFKNLETPISGVTHIEVPNYTITEATFVGVLFEDGTEVSTLLNNLGTDVPSGKILLTQLERGEYDETTSPVNYDQAVKAIIITPKSRKNVDANWDYVSTETSNVSIPEVRLYTDEEVSTIGTTQSNVIMNSITTVNNKLQLNVRETGTYKVSVLSVSGRVISSKKVVMSTGVNLVSGITENLATGINIISITNGSDINFASKIIIQ